MKHDRRSPAPGLPPAALRGHPRIVHGNGTATPPTALKLPDIEHQEYGVAKPVEFRWNQLLSFDACVQCGKCEAACPRSRRASR